MAKRWQGFKPFGKNMEKECCNQDKGFVGRLLFILGVLLALDQLGLLTRVSFWVKALTVVGFTLMRL